MYIYSVNAEDRFGEDMGTGTGTADIGFYESMFGRIKQPPSLYLCVRVRFFFFIFFSVRIYRTHIFNEFSLIQIYTKISFG